MDTTSISFSFHPLRIYYDTFNFYELAVEQVVWMTAIITKGSPKSISNNTVNSLMLLKNWLVHRDLQRILPNCQYYDIHHSIDVNILAL